MLSVSNTDGPPFNARSQTQQYLAPDSSTAQSSVTPDVMSTPDPTPKSLTADRLEALFQMQKTDPFCKWISKWLSNGKAPMHETELFIHVKGLLYKHITDSRQKFLALVIPKSWKYTVLVGAHDRLRHQGYILSDNGTEFKNNLMDQVLKQLGIEWIFSTPYHPQSNAKLEVFHKYLKPILKKLCEKAPSKLGSIT